MKFYETHYEEYIQSIENYNIHNELKCLYSNFPNNLQKFDNLIIYGASGTCKYSQVLYFIKKYSHSYIQQYNHPSCHIQIKFILITEHISFIPNNIINACKVISFKRPSKLQYSNISIVNKNDNNSSFLKRIQFQKPQNSNKQNAMAAVSE